MKKEDINIVFFGTPEFAVASLDRLVKGGYNVAAVVTMPDKPGRRGNKFLESDVKKYAVANNLPLLQPERLKAPEFIEQLKEIDADLFIVIAFRMLPEIVWSMPRLGTFNLHGSLLPKYRGAAPINRAIMNGETETGITTFFLKHEIDTGDIIDQERITISDEDDAGTVHDRLMALGAEMVERNVDDIISGDVTPKAQPEGEFIPAPKIFTEDCRIDWNRDAIAIHNQVRGLSPYPAAFTLMEDESGKEVSLKIFRTELTDLGRGSLKPGDIKREGHNLYVAADDRLLKITSLQPAGKSRMATSAFLNGYHPLRFK